MLFGKRKLKLDRISPNESEVAFDFDELERIKGEDLFPVEIRPIEPEVTDLDVTIPRDFKIIQQYWVNKPFAKIIIAHNPLINDWLYIVSEPKLSMDEMKLLDELKERVLIKIINSDLVDSVPNPEILIRNEVEEFLKGAKIDDENVIAKLNYYITRDFVGYGKIDPIMRDPNIEDISCNGIDEPVYVYHWEYGIHMPTNIMFTAKELNDFIQRLAQMGGQYISISRPIKGVTLPDGSRVQLTLGEVTTKGSTFTIRKFRGKLITPADLIKWNTFSAEEMAFLWMAVEHRKNILVIGGTASGKTTTLNAIAFFIPLNAKIVTIEDTREIRLPHKNWIPAVTREPFTSSDLGRVDMFDLLKSALRQRPEYIIVGEVRGREAQTLFQAMSTGHTTLSTFHADSVETAIHRLEYPPLSVPRSMLTALDVMVVQSQVFLERQMVRRNVNISEIHGIDPETKTLVTQDIYKWLSTSDEHVRLIDSLESSDVLRRIAMFRGWNSSELEYNFELRTKALLKLAEEMHNPTEFINFIKAYHARGNDYLEEFVGE